MRKINSVTYEVGSAKAEQAAGMFGLAAGQRTDKLSVKGGEATCEALDGRLAVC